MKLLRKPLFTGFAPNSTLVDVCIALSFLFFPWKWLALKKGDASLKVSKKLGEFHNIPHAYTFDSGRTALYIALQALDIGKGDEVLVQAYTCVVVINAIIWTGATPVYVDILPDFTMDPDDAQKKVHSTTKAIILQHTFGAPAQTATLLSIARKFNLRTIEDCAHALAIPTPAGITGTMADIGMLSFGTDKMISSGRGGALICSSDHIAKRIASAHASLPHMPIRDILRHLAHWPIFYICKPLYNIFLGKLILAMAKKLSITHKIISTEEKQGRQNIGYPAQLPNSLGTILQHQLSILQRKNKHRTIISNIYKKNLNPAIVQPLKNKTSAIPLRYPICINNPAGLHAYAKKNGIILGDWYQTVIAPRDIDTKKTAYTKGSCPAAETLATRSINLPTHEGISKRDAHRVVQIVNAYTNTHA